MYQRDKHDASLYAHERGSALVIALVLLVGLAVIGFTAMSSTTLNERVAGNERDRQRAFSAAESAVRNAESYLDAVYPMPVYGGSKGHFRMNEIINPGTSASLESVAPPPSGTSFDVASRDVWLQDAALDWVKTEGIVYGTTDASPAPPLPDLDTQPRFFVEEMPRASGRPLNYRITAVGWGNAQGTVVLQSYYTPIQDTAPQ